MMPITTGVRVTLRTIHNVNTKDVNAVDSDYVLAYVLAPWVFERLAVLDAAADTHGYAFIMLYGQRYSHPSATCTYYTLYLIGKKELVRPAHANNPN